MVYSFLFRTHARKCTERNYGLYVPTTVGWSSCSWWQWRWLLLGLVVMLFVVVAMPRVYSDLVAAGGDGSGSGEKRFEN